MHILSRMTGALALAAWLSFPTGGSAQDATSFGIAAGRDEFLISCSSCHGTSAKGDGPVASVLTIKPADLTKISARNGGVFPLVDIATLIHGKTTGRAHGNEMPIWGNRYLAESAESYGPFIGEMIVRARILSLVFYLESIQEH